MSNWGHIPTDRGSEMSLGHDLAWEIGSKFSDYCCVGGRDLVASRSPDHCHIDVGWICWRSSGLATSSVIYSELLSSASKSREHNQCQMQNSDLIQVCVWPPLNTLCLDLVSELSQLKCLEFHSQPVLLLDFLVWDASFHFGAKVSRKHLCLFISIVHWRWATLLKYTIIVIKEKIQDGISETKVIKHMKVQHIHLIYEHSGGFTSVRIQLGDGFSLPRVLSTRNVIATKWDIWCSWIWYCGIWLFSFLQGLTSTHLEGADRSWSGRGHETGIASRSLSTPTLWKLMFLIVSMPVPTLEWSAIFVVVWGHLSVH